MNPEDEASAIKIRNVIDMAITFSAMIRVFGKGSKQQITQQLEKSYSMLATVDGKDTFEKIHSEFCEWFTKNVVTSKKHKNASYGQAGKVFNVVGKVYVYYCHLPDSETAARLLPMLHAAVDNLMMKKLKDLYPKENIKAKTIEAVSRTEYFAIQKLVAKHIHDEFKSLILPVQYDDIMWFRLNRLI